MTRIAIIDYGSGNLRSVANALQQVATASESIQVTTNAEDVARADRIVLPGVGAFADCWRGLNALPAMVPTLTRRVQEQGIPFLGICVGMQLLATGGYEHKVSPGLGWIGGAVRKLHVPGLKIPHMGWNDLRLQYPDHPLFTGLPPAPQVYFVHSYHLQPPSPAIVLATADYGRPLVAAVGHNNIVGTQFHPEKSQQTGLKLLRNFLDWQV